MTPEDAPSPAAYERGLPVGLRRGERSGEAELPGVPVTLIRARRGYIPIDLGEIWRFRGLLYFLVWKDLRVRYKQAALGVAWAVLQPALLLAVFTVFFGLLLQVPSEGVPYPLFLLAALLPWQLFSYSLFTAGNCLLGNQSLLTRVYFPRLVLPLAAVLGGVLDFLIAFVLLGGLALWYGVAPTWNLLALPLLLAATVLTALSVGLWLSALNVRFRDVHHAVPLLVQLWFFATPIFYGASLVPDPWRDVLALNPLAGLVAGFRWALLGTGEPGLHLAVSMGAVLVLLWSGLLYFRRAERTFADVV